MCVCVCVGGVSGWSLTELSDAPHARGQQGLLDGAQLRLAVRAALATLPRALLLVPVQVQAVRKAQHT